MTKSRRYYRDYLRAWRERRRNRTKRWIEVTPLSPLPKAKLFWRHVTKTGTCWLWTGALYSNGYGHVGVQRDGQHYDLLAHRVAYRFTGKVIRPGLDLDHLCRNRHCVRPDHVEPATRSKNLRRGVNVGGSRVSPVRGGPRGSL